MLYLGSGQKVAVHEQHFRWVSRQGGTGPRRNGSSCLEEESWPNVVPGRVPVNKNSHDIILSNTYFNAPQLAGIGPVIVFVAHIKQRHPR